MSNLEKIKSTDRSRTSDYLHRYNLSNYKHFMEIMTPEELAFILADCAHVNTCLWCSEMTEYARGNMPCDLRCFAHTLEFLNQEYDKNKFRFSKFDSSDGNFGEIVEKIREDEATE